MGLFSFFSADWPLKQVARNTTYFYAQLRRIYPKLPEEQARFMAIYVNAWSARNELPEDMIRSLVTTWADYDWSIVCYRYAVMYVKIVGRDSTIDDSVMGMMKNGKKIGLEIEAAMREVENGGTKFRDRVLSMPPNVFLKLVEMSLPPERRSEAPEIMLKAIGPDE